MPNLIKILITGGVVTQFTLVSCSSQSQISPNLPVTQATTSSVSAKTVTVSSSANETKKIYPPEAISNYIDVCTKGGSTKKSCNCFISKVQNIYSLEKLIQINNDGAIGKPYPKDINEILNSCQEKVAVAPETTAPVSSTPIQKKEAKSEITKAFPRKLLENYLNEITTTGNSGITSFCPSSQDDAVRFFSPRSYTILQSGIETDDFADYYVRIDSSNQGGSQITANWHFYFKKENQGEWCIKLIAKQ